MYLYTIINNQKISKMKNLKFKTSRGGRFHNAGHVSFIDFENINEGSTFDEMSWDEEKEIYLDWNGEEADCAICEDGTGWLNIDGDYDTTIVECENSLNVKQINALKRAVNNHWATEEIERIMNEYYSEYMN
jgi:hypothetical protein